MFEDIEVEVGRSDVRLVRDYETTEIKTLRRLQTMSVDAADAATRFAELMRLDGDQETADLFLDISRERTISAQRLGEILADLGQKRTGGRGTLRGLLLRWRLRIAKHLPVGYHDGDDRRFLLRLAARCSDSVSGAYVEAEKGPLGPDCRKEVHRQAAAVRAANHRVHQVAAAARRF